MSTAEVNRDDEIIAQVLATYTTPVSKIKCKVYLNEPFKTRSFSGFLPVSAGKSRYTTDRRASCSGDTFASTAIKAFFVSGSVLLRFSPNYNYIYFRIVHF